jgi:hypothetical protein
MSERILADPPERPEPPEDAPPPQKPTPPAPKPAPADEAKPEPEREPAAAEGEATEGEAPAPDPAAEETAKRLREYKERVDALTREKWEARRQAEATAARLAELERPAPQPGQAQDPVEVAKYQLRMEAAQRDFNERCNKTFQAGKAEFGENFEHAVRALQAVGAGARLDFLDVISDLPNGHQVYHQLAGNLDEAARLLALPPRKMDRELDRMSLEAERAAQAAGGEPAAPRSPSVPVSSAPAPIRPIGGGSRSAPSLDRMTTAEFIKARDREEVERRKAKERIT